MLIDHCLPVLAVRAFFLTASAFAAFSFAVRKDAAEDKMDAEYKVAVEKCDAQTGAAKDSCVTAAKAKYKK